MRGRRASRLVSAAFIAACLFTFAAPAGAQTVGTTPPGNQQVISANPFLLMFEYFNVEYQRKHKPSTSWGASTSFVGFGDVDYGNVAGFYRYYPQGSALSGFYIGGRGGVHRVSRAFESDVYFGLGFELGYDWLLGREKNFSVGIGAGATRLFGGDLRGVSLTVPTLRFVNIGWSF